MDINTTSIKDIAYPEIEARLSLGITTTKFKQFMSKFMQKRQKELYSNMPSKQMYYSAEDVNQWFAAMGINRKIVKTAIKGCYYYPIGNFNPSYAKDFK